MFVQANRIFALARGHQETALRMFELAWAISTKSSGCLCWPEAIRIFMLTRDHQHKAIRMFVLARGHQDVCVSLGPPG